MSEIHVAKTVKTSEPYTWWEVSAHGSSLKELEASALIHLCIWNGTVAKSWVLRDFECEKIFNAAFKIILAAAKELDHG